MDRVEQKMAGARVAYAAIAYRGAALDPSRLRRRSAGFLPRLGWRPAWALLALLALLVALIFESPGPEPAPTALGEAALTLTSPMNTLSAARRAIAGVPVAPERPTDGIFYLPAPPQRPSRFAESSG